MLGLVRQAARLLYDYLGLWCGVGFLIGTGGLLWLWSSGWLLRAPSLWTFALWLVVSLLDAPVLGGLAYQTHRAVRRQEIGFILFLEGVVKLGWSSLRLMAALLFVGSVLLVNIWFYWGLGSPLVRSLALLLGVLSLWWSVIALYAFPLLVEHELGVYRERGWRRGTLWVLYRAFLLTLGSPGLTFGLYFLGWLWSLLNFLIPLGLVTVWLPGVLIGASLLTYRLLIRYNVLEEPPEPPVPPDDRFRIRLGGESH